MRCENLNFMGIEKLEEGMEFTVKIRYNHRGAPCVIEKVLSEDEVICRFREPQRAVTPGQAAVFYQDGYVAAAGTITGQR